MSSRTVHNINRFQESEEISVHKGQGRSAILDALDLQALRQPALHLQTGMVLWRASLQGLRDNIYFQKSSSVNCLIKKCKFNCINQRRSQIRAWSRNAVIFSGLNLINGVGVYYSPLNGHLAHLERHHICSKINPGFRAAFCQPQNVFFREGSA